MPFHQMGYPFLQNRISHFQKTDMRLSSHPCDEHFSFHCLLRRWHCLDKVVRSYAIWLWNISFQDISQCYCFMNTTQNLIYILCLMQDFHMMRKTKTKELISVNFGRHRRPFCQRESVILYLILQIINIHFARHWRVNSEWLPKLGKLAHIPDVFGRKSPQSWQLFTQLFTYFINSRCSPSSFTGVC